VRSTLNRCNGRIAADSDDWWWRRGVIVKWTGRRLPHGGFQVRGISSKTLTTLYRNKGDEREEASGPWGGEREQSDPMAKASMRD
jgi:hypothetical protein